MSFRVDLCLANINHNLIPKNMKSKLLIILTAVILFLIPDANYGQVAPTLGTTSSFALFTGSGAFDNLGATIITGNIGSNTYSPSGFPIPGTVIGNIYNASDAITATAAADVLTAYAALTQAGAVLGVTLDGLTINPGVYNTGAAATLNAGQTLTLNGLGNPNSIFIIRIGGALTTGTFTNIVLINSADLCNVYWQVNGAFTLGDGSVFRGTLIATGAIHLLEASSLLGRGLSTGGAIDTHNNIVTIGTAPATPGAITGTAAQCASLAGQTYSITAVANTTTFTWAVPAGWSITSGAGTTGITVTTGTAGQNGNITVTAGNGCGTSAAGSLAVTVNACALNASFTGTPLSVCLGSMVTFTNTSTGTSGATTYSWNFGAGATPATSNTIGPIAVTYSTGGLKTITLTITDGTTSTVTQTNYITVNLPPSAPGIGLITQPTCVLSTGSVPLTGLPGVGTWTVTESVGSTTITGSGTTANFSGLSANNYTFTVTDAAGCTSVASGSAVIDAQPPTPVVTNQTISISSGGTFTVSPAAVPVGTTYTWTAPGYTGSVTGGSAQAIPQTSISGTLTIPSGTGTAIYTVTPVSGSCIGVPFNVTVTVSLICVPVSIGTQPVNSSMCATSGNASFTVSAAGTAPFIYQWQYNNGGVWANVINGTPTGAVYINQTSTTLGISGITLSGSYQYRSYLTNCAGTNNATSNIGTLVVTSAPSALLAGIITQPTCLLPTGSVVLSGLPAGNWTINPGAITGSTASTTITGLFPGTYNFTVTDASGCISSASANVVITAQAVPAAPTVVLIQPDCAIPLGTITVLAPVGAGMTYSINGTDYTNTTGIFTMVPMGTYTVTAKNSDGCISSR
jgi:PKD repeat protein